MLIRPRWQKVLADLWSNKTRSLLVIASIAVGLFAVGIITINYFILAADMRSSYAAVNPANILIRTSDFDKDLVDRVARVEGVKEAEGVRDFTLRLEASPGEWILVNVRAIDTSAPMSINLLSQREGTWPPGEREIVFDTNKFADTNASLGSQVKVELPSGKVRQLSVTGITRDQTIGAAGGGSGFFRAPVQAYISTASLEWLEQPDNFNHLFVTVAGASGSEAHIRQVSEQVRTEVENNNHTIYGIFVSTSYDHPNSTYLDAMSGVLMMLGFLVVFLSGFLITNTLSALLTQQVQQVGVIKTIGGRRVQITGIYMMLILVFGLLAIAASVPLADAAAYLILGFLSTAINFELGSHKLVLQAILLQAIIALIVPQIAGFLPIWHGTQISVQEALSGQVQSRGTGRKSWMDRRLGSIRRISRPMLISLRNTFRRRGRLVLTLVTLSLGGAIFIATFNVRASLTTYISMVSKYFLADVNITLDRPYRIEEIQMVLTDLPGVAEVEGWAQASGELVLEDGSVGESVGMLGADPASQLIEPILIHLDGTKSRWLQPGDRNAIVLSERFQSRFPELRPGDTLRLNVAGQETDFVVVGFFQLAGKSGGFLAYTPYEFLSELIHQPKKAIGYRVVASQAGLSIEEQQALGREVEQHLRARGYRLSDVSAGLSLRTSSAKGLDILTIFLLIMASLTALVGSIGLTGTMSLNVMERTREIGIMRAIGASDRILIKMVLVEGLLIGSLSWVFASLLAFPISKFMSDVISQAIFDAPSTFATTPAGFMIWLGMVLFLSALSSLMPARNAARLTIREVLAYE